MQLPQRPDSHITESDSADIFKNIIPKGWVVLSATHNCMLPARRVPGTVQVGEDDCRPCRHGDNNFCNAAGKTDNRFPAHCQTGRAQQRAPARHCRKDEGTRLRVCGQYRRRAEGSGS